MATKDSQRYNLKSDKRENIFLNKNFMLLFSGRLVSQLGDAIFLFSLAWYVLQLTHSASQTGILMMLNLLPAIIVGPIVGVFVDRVDRKKILVGMDILRGIILLVMGMMLYNNKLPLSLIYVGSILLSLIGAVYSPACSATIPNIVSRENITKANSMDSIAVNGSSIIGGLIGSILYVKLGIAFVFFINAASFLLSGISQLFIKINSNVLKKEKADENSGIKRVGVELLEGYHYLRERKGLFILFLYFVGMNCLMAPILQVYLPYIFNNILFASAQQLAYTQAGFGVGMVLGAVITAILPQREKVHKRIIFSFLIFQIMIFGFAIPLIPSMQGVMSIRQILILYISLAIVAGTFLGIGDIPVSVVYQKDIPDEIRGRINAIIVTFGRSAMPFGFLLGGLLAEVIPMYILNISTAAVLVIMTAAMNFSKSIKEI